MAPLTRETESPASQATDAPPPNVSKPQPVAAEIPITVNGARTIAGSDKREPFSETSQTVLVFASGAVIRLVAPVGPGQLLFVTNDKSKKEVVCQVLKSKQNGAAGGYVELKFTEPAVDFWGIRLSAANPAVASSNSTASGNVVAMPAPPVKSLQQTINDLKVPAPPAVVANTQPAPDAKPTIPASDVAPIEKSAAPSDKTINSASTNPPAASSKIPTLSEFLTHGNNGPELRSQDKPKIALVALPAKQAKDSPKPGDLPTVQLSSVLLGAENTKPAPQMPAPGTSTFDFAVDEVKIPAWLEPLARNSAETPQTSDLKPTESKLADTSVSSEQLESAPASAPTVPAPESESAGANFTISSEGPTPNFGSSLSIHADSASADSSSGFNWKIILVVVGLLIAGALGWYWYSSQTAHASSTESLAAPVENSVPSPVAASASTDNGTKAAQQSVASSSFRATEKPVSTVPLRSTPASTPADMNQLRDTPDKSIAIEEPAKKPALGTVHLAAPKLNRNLAAAESATADPGLALGGVAGGDPANLPSLDSKSRQPAAPIVVGGEVKPARLLSSTPPVYPQLARTQRVSGAVIIDASIDANGQVSATRVISGPALLHQAAMDAVKQWKYQPATLNGQPTAMHLNVTVQFRLQ